VILTRGRECPSAPSISEVRPPRAVNANQISDTEKQEKLRELADKFIVLAPEIESKE
jgi:hypothetical protein